MSAKKIPTSISSLTLSDPVPDPMEPKNPEVPVKASLSIQDSIIMKIGSDIEYIRMYIFELSKQLSILPSILEKVVTLISSLLPPEKYKNEVVSHPPSSPTEICPNILSASNSLSVQIPFFGDSSEYQRVFSDIPANFVVFNRQIKRYELRVHTRVNADMLRAFAARNGFKIFEGVP